MVDLVGRSSWFKARILPHEGALRVRMRRAAGNETDLDDLVSEALARAYGAHDWADIADGRHYLFRIARNVLIDTARRNALISFDSVADLDDSQADSRTENGISARDELRQVQRAIEAMPPQCRRVFILRRVHERSIGEIAAEMELSVSTVEKHLGKAVQLLARAIAEIDEGVFGRGGTAAQRGGDAPGARSALLGEPAR
ncbi:MAG: sigma-70 family RNA polymerase sigma factor [Rhizorhabdus sp.]